MIGLSVAVGRFVEALFWGIFRVAGAVAGVLILGVVVLVVAWVIARKMWARRRR
ncbi:MULTISPECIES: hypothetical protein [unclassified Sphingomonas]|uniref:hypothetical protein n=1 Tax=unclassified Sphingomonas TaxID=196159 RepID=UPI000FF7F306|nr:MULTISPECIES: hypothetical protein [unclassified Sphingomonas]RKE47246.1 hypothetical protein C8J39_2291 [Sphingomonas sp. PP-CC-1A-547]TCM07728.1 hypothetical protein C8J41_103640 [Sphingomonas sp. PP-CC-3G-468]